MDLRQLAALMAVADTGTFSAAADKLHTVQSNVSAHVARLERQLGATLVDRGAGRLTEEGEVVVARARRVQAELDALVADVHALRHEVVGEVRVGVIGSVARWLVPPLHNAMTRRHPKVHMVVVDASTTSLAPQLVAGTLSLAICNLPIADPDVVVTPLFEEDMVLVAPNDHPIAAKDRIRVQDLAGVPLILPPRGTSFRSELDHAAGVVGVRLIPRAEIDGVRLITSLAFDGVAPALVPSTAVLPHLAPLGKRIAVDGLPPRRVGIVQRRRGMLSAPARSLIGAVHEVLPGELSRLPGVKLSPKQLG